MRVQVNLKDDFVKLLDEWADEIGISRSSLCAMYIMRSYLEEPFVSEHDKREVVNTYDY